MAFGNDATITLSIVAKDLASGNIGKAVSGLDALAKKGGLVGAMAQGVGQSFGQMINPVMLAGRAIGVVTDFLKDGIASAIEEEASLKRLDTALENNVASWDGSHAAIEADIEAKMRLGFQDDALRESMIKLVTATGNQEEAMRLNSLAMDIARARHIDLAAATDLVVKANMGNVGALRRAGIQIDKNSTKTEILAKLTETYAGQAEAYGETTAGAMESAQVAIGELAEDFGAELLPAITEAAQFITRDFIPAIRDIGVAIDNLERQTGADNPSSESLFGRLFPDHDTGALGGTIIDTLTDAIHQGNAWLTGKELLIPIGTGEIVPGAGKAELDTYMAFLQGRADAGGHFVANGVRTGFLAGWPAVTQAMNASVAEAQRIFNESGRGIDNNLADSLRGNKDVVKSAMDDVMWAIKHPMEQQRELARIEGALTTLEYKRGLASNNDEINTVIDQQMQILRGAWQDITGRAYDAGAAAGAAWRTAYRRTLDFNSTVNAFTGFVVPRGGGGRNRAQGGSVNAGEPYIVGEERAELFIPDQNGYIAPRVPAGGGTFNFHYHGLTPPTPSQAQQIAQAMMPGFVREMRRQQIL